MSSRPRVPFPPPNLGRSVAAGETVFALPLLVTRYFRPTFLELFGFSNTDLGKAMAVYGVVVMVAYFPGGPLADRFSARNLLFGSLVMTSVGGYTWPSTG